MPVAAISATVAVCASDIGLGVVPDHIDVPEWLSAIRSKDLCAIAQQLSLRELIRSLVWLPDDRLLQLDAFAWPSGNRGPGAFQGLAKTSLAQTR